MDDAALREQVNALPGFIGSIPTLAFSARARSGRHSSVS
jgi:hypothetical protein